MASSAGLVGWPNTRRSRRKGQKIFHRPGTNGGEVSIVVLSSALRNMATEFLGCDQPGLMEMIIQLVALDDKHDLSSKLFPKQVQSTIQIWAPKDVPKQVLDLNLGQSNR